MATLKQIASDLGVSFTLVSKVLSGRLSTTGVSEKTREAILQHAKDLNYTPNRLAVALKAGRKGVAGIFLHQHGSPGSDISDRLMKGIAEGLQSSGLHMWLRFFTSTNEFVAACDAKLCSEVDGLIVGGVGHPELLPKFLELESRNVPVVSLFHDTASRECRTASNVTTDYEMQGYLPTKHLLDLGLRRLACLDFLEHRTAGFRRAFREAGLEPDPDLIISTLDCRREDGEAALRAIWDRVADLEGIVCQADTQAMGVINEMIRNGLRVPEDLKVTGIDNSPLAHNCIVPITSVSSEMMAAGKRAVEMLISRLSGAPSESARILPRLLVRASTGG